MIYMAIEIAGRGVVEITSFNDRRDMYNYAAAKTACSDTIIRVSDSISNLCDALYDVHMSNAGAGVQSIRRVSRRDAIAHIRDGAIDSTPLFWHR